MLLWDFLHSYDGISMGNLGMKEMLKICLLLVAVLTIKSVRDRFLTFWLSAVVGDSISGCK